MLKVAQILDSTRRVAVLVAGAAACIVLLGCGQRGPLYLPTGEAAAGRATLPQTLSPTPPVSAPTNTGTGAANPAPRP